MATREQTAAATGLAALLSARGATYTWNGQSFLALEAEPVTRAGPGPRGLAFGGDWDIEIATLSSNFTTTPKPGQSLQNAAGAYFPIKKVSLAPGGLAVSFYCRRPSP